MRTYIAPQIVTGAATLLIAAAILAGCASPAAPVAPTQAPAVAGATPQAASAAAAPTQGTGNEPTSSGQRVSGTVKSIAGSTITLNDGTTITLSPDAQVIQVQPATASDLQPQEYVAITATRQPDGTLLASLVNIFAESQRGVAAGQRPLPGGNLMTNATITGVNGDTFTASFPGGDAMVKLAPGAKVMRFVQASPQDIVSGKTISAFVTNGVARSISLQ